MFDYCLGFVIGFWSCYLVRYIVSRYFKSDFQKEIQKAVNKAWNSQNGYFKQIKVKNGVWTISSTPSDKEVTS